MWIIIPKVAYNAFPRDEEHVRVISELTDNRPEYWSVGKHLFKEGDVKRIRQIGELNLHMIFAV